MRTLACISAVLLALTARAAPPQAAGAPAGEEFITVEVVIGKQTRMPLTLRAPVVRGQRKSFDDKFGGTGWESTGSCGKDIGCGGLVIVTADHVTGDGSAVTVALKYTDRKGCDQTKEAPVVRGETTEFKMKCGAKVKAYYAPRRAAAN
jgi:hypothetical protein